MYWKYTLKSKIVKYLDYQKNRQLFQVVDSYFHRLIAFMIIPN